MLANISGFPGEHWHGRDSDTNLRRDVLQAGVDFAPIEHTIEKRPLVRCQIEQEGEPVATERDGFVNSRVDHSSGGKPAIRRRARVANRTVVERHSELNGDPRRLDTDVLPGFAKLASSGLDVTKGADACATPWRR